MSYQSETEFLAAVAQFEAMSFSEFAAHAKAVARSVGAKEKNKEAIKKAKKAEKKLRKEVKKADKAAAKACKQAKKAEGAVAASNALVASIGRFEQLASSASAPAPAQEVEQIRFIGNIVEGGSGCTMVEVPKNLLAEEETFNGFAVGGAAETEVIVTSTDENGKVEVLSHTIENNKTGETVNVAAKAAELATANPEVANSALGNALLNPKRAQTKPQVQVRQPQRVAPKKG